MTNKTPAELESGTPNDNSVVHSSEDGTVDSSKKHNERSISRLQGTAPLYDATKTYDINDLTTESGITYQNTTAIVVPEAFNSANWKQLGDVASGTGPYTAGEVPRYADLTGKLFLDAATQPVLLDTNGVFSGVDAISDVDDNEILRFITPGASAVNFFLIESSDSTDPLIFQAEGTDADIDIAIVAKGSAGEVIVPSVLRTSNYQFSSGIDPGNGVVNIRSDGLSMTSNVPTGGEHDFNIEGNTLVEIAFDRVTFEEISLIGVNTFTQINTLGSTLFQQARIGVPVVGTAMLHVQIENTSSFIYNQIQYIPRNITGGTQEGEMSIQCVTGGSLTEFLSINDAGSGNILFRADIDLDSNTILNIGGISFDDGVRITFNPDNINAGINVGENATDPSTPINGDIYYQSSVGFRGFTLGAWESIDGDVKGGIGTYTQNQITTYQDATGKLLRDVQTNIVTLSNGIFSGVRTLEFENRNITDHLVTYLQLHANTFEVNLPTGTIADNGFAIEFGGLLEYKFKPTTSEWGAKNMDDMGFTTFAIPTSVVPDPGVYWMGQDTTGATNFLRFNVPTGDAFDFSIEGTQSLQISSGSMRFTNPVGSPFFNLENGDTTLTVGNIVGVVFFEAIRDGGSIGEYARIQTIVRDRSEFNRDGELNLSAIVDGTNTEMLSLNDAGSGNILFGVTADLNTLNIDNMGYIRFAVPAAGVEPPDDEFWLGRDFDPFGIQVNMPEFFGWLQTINGEFILDVNAGSMIKYSGTNNLTSTFALVSRFPGIVVGDIPAEIIFEGQRDIVNDQVYAKINAVARNIDVGTIEGELDLSAVSSNSLKSFLHFNKGGNDNAVFGTGVNVEIDNSYLQLDSITTLTDTGSVAVGQIFMDIGNSNVLSIIRGTTVIDLETPQEFLGPWTADHDAGAFDLFNLNLISDANGDEVVQFKTAISGTPVNFVTITNSESGVDPTLSADGPDADIGIEYRVKGLGRNTFVGQVVFRDVTDESKLVLFNLAPMGAAGFLQIAFEETSLFVSVTVPDTGGVFQEFVLTEVSQTLTNKTLTTPTIGNFTNATHNHTNAAGGAQLTATTALNATGTPDATTFLRGDDTWAVPIAELAVIENTDITTDINTATFTAIPLNGTSVIIDSNFTASGAGIQCNFTGRIRVTYAVYMTSLGVRVSIQCQPFIAGVATGLISSMGYIRNANSHDQSTVNGSYILQVTSGQVVDIRGQRETTLTTLTTMTTAGGSQLAIERLS